MHRAAIITLRIHEHFQCLNEKVMFYIRIAHNKRLRDVNIGCAPWLARFLCLPAAKSALFLSGLQRIRSVGLECIVQQFIVS